MTMNHTTVHVSSRTILSILATLAGVFLVFQIREIIVTLFLALIIMSALNPGVNKLERKKIPRPLGIAMLYLCVFGFLGLLFGIVIPPLAKELSGMVKYLQPSNLPAELLDLKFTV